MAIVVNQTSAKVSAASPKTGNMYDFVPGHMTEVEDAELKELEKVPLIKRCLDNEDFVTGKAARKLDRQTRSEIKDQEEKEDADAKKKGK